jgi:hypothetical protein
MVLTVGAGVVAAGILMNRAERRRLADERLHAKPAHDPVWNPPHQPHLTKTGKIPFLSLFVWTRDVNDLAVVIPAQDWPALEAQEIG